MEKLSSVNNVILLQKGWTTKENFLIKIFLLIVENYYNDFPNRF